MNEPPTIRVVCTRSMLARYCPAAGHKGAGVPEIAQGQHGTLYHGVPGAKLGDVCVLFDGMAGAVTLPANCVTAAGNLQSNKD